MRKPLLCLKTKPKLKLNSCCFSFQWQFDLAPNNGTDAEVYRDIQYQNVDGKCSMYEYN